MRGTKIHLERLLHFPWYARHFYYINRAYGEPAWMAFLDGMRLASVRVL